MAVVLGDGVARWPATAAVAAGDVAIRREPRVSVVASLVRRMETVSFVTEVSLPTEEEEDVSEAFCGGDGDGDETSFEEGTPQPASETAFSTWNNVVEWCKKDPDGYLMESVYTKHGKWCERRRAVVETLAKLAEDVRRLRHGIESEDAAMPVTEARGQALEQLTRGLRRSTDAFRLLRQLAAAHEPLVEFEECRAERRFERAASKLLEAEHALTVDGGGSGDDDDGPALSGAAVDALKADMSTAKDSLRDECVRVFERHVKMVRGRPKPTAATRRSMLKIRKERRELADALSALAQLDRLEPLGELSAFLWRHVCKLVVSSTTSLKTDEDDNYSVLCVTRRSPFVVGPSRSQVLAKLTRVFKFLKDNFDHECGHLRTLALIGNDLKYELSEALLGGRLKSRLSECDDVDPEYRDAVERIKKFQRQLVEMGVLDPVHNPLVAYTDNVDVVLINKICRDYASDAVTLMKKDLQTCALVGAARESATPGEFPECRVSSGSLELVDLSERLLKRAASSSAAAESESSAAKLLCALQSVFYQYEGVVCGQHERRLQSSAGHVALFRNNCMYLAHRLLRLGERYAGRFSSAALPDPRFFESQAHRLRSLGGEVFLAFVEDHLERAALLLRESGLTCESAALGVSEHAVVAVGHCVRQLQLLRLAWRKILPPSVFAKTLGYAADTLCRRLVDAVIAARDVSPTARRRLVESFAAVLTSLPKLFGDPSDGDMRSHVIGWSRFESLAFILGAPLDAIEERWANGTGPLATTFTHQEIKTLLRTFFGIKLP